MPFDDLPVPAFTGIRAVQPDLAALRELIDWQFFFLAWELKGKYPAILGQPAARELFDDGNALLDEIIAGGLLQARGVYGFWPALGEGDDILVSAERGPVRLPMLRQQTAKRAGRPNRCLADYVAPAGDYLGGFAVAIHGAEKLAASYQADRDDYRAIMVKALADRLAEAFAEYIHLQARREWFEPEARPSLEDLHAERFRGIRPGLRLPRLPGPQRQAGAVRPARRGPGRHGADRVVRDDPGGQRQRADASRTPRRVTSPSGGSAGTRPRTTPAAGRPGVRGRTVAAAQPGLRPQVAPGREGG